MNIAYSGWIGHRNIGDEAIYLAADQLFRDFQLVEYGEISNYNAFVLGGGTTLPRYNPTELSTECKLKAAIGVGVRDPTYWNRKDSRFDLDYYLGRYDHEELLENPFIRYLLTPFDKSIKGLNIKRNFIGDGEFIDVKESSWDFIGVRGNRSKNILQDYNIDCEVIGDTALYLEPEKYHTNPQNRIGVILRDGYDHWGDSQEYISIVKEFCSDMSDNYEIVLMPFYPKDIDLCRRISSEIPNSTFYDYTTFVDVNGALNQISRCDLIIADKLHGNVLAASTHTPFISLEYRPKNRDFAESIGMGEYNTKTSELTREWLDEKTEKLIHNDSIIMEIKGNVNERRDQILKYTDKIISELI